MDEFEMGKRLAAAPDGEGDRQATIELQTVFGQSLRAARLRADLSQSELARRAGIQQDDVSRLEAGRVNVTLYTMTRLARVVGTEVWAMLRPTPTSE